MKLTQLAANLILAVLTFSLITLNDSRLLAEDDGKWSEEVCGLQARLVLVEKPKRHGARWLVPYMELRNARDFNNAMNALEIDVSIKQLKLELVDEKGKPLPEGFQVRSGPGPALSTVTLPYDSFMRLSLEGKGWGIPPAAVAVMPTDSEFFALTDADKGKVFLRATLIGDKRKPGWKDWHGTLKVPPVRVDWDLGRS